MRGQKREAVFALETRASIFKGGWIAGSSPAMTRQVIRVFSRGRTSGRSIAISSAPGTSGLLALIGIAGNDWIDEVERRPRNPPQAALIPLLAPWHPRDGSDPRPLRG